MDTYQFFNDADVDFRRILDEYIISTFSLIKVLFVIQNETKGQKFKLLNYISKKVFNHIYIYVIFLLEDNISFVN
jgi:hypothetical protein